MIPFTFTNEALKLKDSYLDPHILKELWPSLSNSERKKIIHLWFTEGIPYAFKESPVVYESIREWVAIELTVTAKNVSLIGSARSGFSMNPHKGYGNPFSAKSDIDLFIVSPSLFDRFSNDFSKWKSDWESAQLNPNYIGRFDESNIKRCGKNIQKGFLDSNKIPNIEQCPNISQANDACFRLMEKIRITSESPDFYFGKQGLWLRVYKSWESMLNQNLLNFNTILLK